MGRSVTSILGIIAIILVIVAAVYYLANEADDDLEIDIGMVEAMSPAVTAIPAGPVVAVRLG
jgi:hypothetical protein